MVIKSSLDLHDINQLLTPLGLHTCLLTAHHSLQNVFLGFLVTRSPALLDRYGRGPVILVCWNHDTSSSCQLPMLDQHLLSQAWTYCSRSVVMRELLKSPRAPLPIPSNLILRI